MKILDMRGRGAIEYKVLRICAFECAALQVVISMDVASSEFKKGDIYDLDFKNDEADGTQRLTGKQLGDFYKSLAKEFPIVSIEDPFDQVGWLLVIDDDCRCSMLLSDSDSGLYFGYFMTG